MLLSVCVCVCVRAEPHISIVLLDLHTMKLKNWRRDIDIENDMLYQQLLEEDAVSCDVSQPC